jgi:transmembrane sensor
VKRSGIEAQDGIDPIMAAATRWFVALHEAPGDADLKPAFEAWRAAEPRHASAYARLQRLWGAAGHLPSLQQAQPAMERRAVLRGVIGAGVGVVAVGGAGRLLLGQHPFADHRTRPGERGSVVFADGSRAELSTATALRTDFSAGRRWIRLLAGEAWFQVAPDPARPFVVEAGRGSATAQAGSFAVAVTREGAEVLATEQGVRVAAGGVGAWAAAGQVQAYDRRGLSSMRDADPSALAWREGRLAFVDRPLGEVVAALDRWTGERTVVIDPLLAERRVTLTLATRNAGEGLARLAEVAPMRVTRLGDVLTLVRKI